jgi:Glycosyl hydrolase family 47
VRRDAQLERVGEYNLRPEFVEALFYESWLAPSAGVRQAARERAWEIFEAIERHCHAPHSFAAIANPDEPVVDGREPAFVHAELPHCGDIQVFVFDFRGGFGRRRTASPEPSGLGIHDGRPSVA